LDLDHFLERIKVKEKADQVLLLLAHQSTVVLLQMQPAPADLVLVITMDALVLKVVVNQVDLMVAVEDGATVGATHGAKDRAANHLGMAATVGATPRTMAARQEANHLGAIVGGRDLAAKKMVMVMAMEMAMDIVSMAMEMATDTVSMVMVMEMDMATKVVILVSSRVDQLAPALPNVLAQHHITQVSNNQANALIWLILVISWSAPYAQSRVEHVTKTSTCRRLL